MPTTAEDLLTTEDLPTTAEDLPTTAEDLATCCCEEPTAAKTCQPAKTLTVTARRLRRRGEARAHCHCSTTARGHHPTSARPGSSSTSLTALMCNTARRAFHAETSAKPQRPHQLPPHTGETKMLHGMRRSAPPPQT